MTRPSGMAENFWEGPDLHLIESSRNAFIPQLPGDHHALLIEVSMAVGNQHFVNRKAMARTETLFLQLMVLIFAEPFAMEALLLAAIVPC